MAEKGAGELELIGREKELGQLHDELDNLADGKGSTVLVSGEAGLGKTRLIEEFRKNTEAKGVKILTGAAAADTIHPFLIFSKALEEEAASPLFHDEEFVRFESIFAVNRAGLLIAQATPTDAELDPDILAGMLSAVQGFVQDSLDGSGKESAGLGKLEYGEMKILIEHGPHLFLTALFKGTEHKDMRDTIKNTLREIEENHGDVLENWSGMMRDIAGVQELIKLVDEGGEPVSPARDAHNVMEVIFGFLESQRQGNAKVPIPVPRR